MRAVMVGAAGCCGCMRVLVFHVAGVCTVCEVNASPPPHPQGKTVEVGRAYFETPKKRYTILDAPGHKSFVPNMIGGASQADIGVLIISARKVGCEAGKEEDGDG